jgi:excinuclease ABC subunit C
MLDAQARVLYVGKARNLKMRVTNYTRPTGHSGRIDRMISETARMMFLTTRTETEALLLEQNLIKQLKPRYNVLLRDDKSFPNILVGSEHAFPQISKHRGAKKSKGNYYGPFASAGAGKPHPDTIATGVPTARLFGRNVRQPQPSLSAVSDQTLFSPLCR